MNEKKRVIKYYDFERQIVVSQNIDGTRPLIPLFTGIGNVSNRLFMFGGKEPDTKQITSKAYEIVRSESDSFEMISINRMFKNRSRSTVACID